MEEDLPSRYEDKKLPILDMKCWISKDGYLEYEHYKKPMASKLVIPARSAHSQPPSLSVGKKDVQLQFLSFKQQYFTSRNSKNILSTLMSLLYLLSCSVLQMISVWQQLTKPMVKNLSFL